MADRGTYPDHLFAVPIVDYLGPLSAFGADFRNDLERMGEDELASFVERVAEQHRLEPPDTRGVHGLMLEAVAALQAWQVVERVRRGLAGGAQG